MEENKVKICGHELVMKMKNEIGPMYRYEVEFGSVFFDDMKDARTKTGMQSTMPVVRMVYAILLNDNESVPFSFGEMMCEASDQEIAECIGVFNRRFAELHRHDDHAETSSNSSEEDSKKKE